MNHFLIVAAHPDDPEEFTYDVECPGVTDACREYRDCLAGDVEVAALHQAWNAGEPRVAHGKRHLFIDNMWMAETDHCHLQDHDRLPDAVDGRFEVGWHAIDWDFDEDGLVIIAIDDKAVA